MPETCPSCGAAAEGRYCNACGAALNAACRECGNPLPRGARFCNECGAPAAPRANESAAAPSRSHLVAWSVAAAAVLALAATLLWPRRVAQEPAPVTNAPTFSEPGGAPAPAASGAAPDISQMTPRERADRLFNRVMQATSTGDSAQARTFAPMAIAAYGMLPERSSDDHYHVAALQIVAGDPAAARAHADTVLQANANHLLALFTAGEAEQARGNAAEARRMLSRFLAAYPEESVRQDVPEYRDHAQALPIMREAAQRIVGGG